MTLTLARDGSGCSWTIFLPTGGTAGVRGIFFAAIAFTSFAASFVDWFGCCAPRLGSGGGMGNPFGTLVCSAPTGGGSCCRLGGGGGGGGRLSFFASKSDRGLDLCVELLTMMLHLLSDCIALAGCTQKTHSSHLQLRCPKFHIRPHQRLDALSLP